MPSAESLRALRFMQLPYGHEAEPDCVEALLRELQNLGVSEKDVLAWVELQVSQWMATAPFPELKRVVTAVGQAAATAEVGSSRQALVRLMQNYFECHASLMKEHGLRSSEATALLSHACLMLELATTELLSGAQISRMLAARDSRAKVSRQVVVEVLKKAGVHRKVTQQQVESLFDQDGMEELEAFGDASFEEAAAKVAATAARMGLGDEFRLALLVLAPTEGDAGVVSPFTPYLQILHYQCCIAAYFDHAIVDVYEFNPRGEAANWLFEKYPHLIAGASNPYLNNAKAVEILDESWVRSKKGAQSKAARAIFLLLSELDSLGFSARREVARWVRLWIRRIIRVAEEMPQALPISLMPHQIGALLTAAREANTGTFGIIEQRCLDAAACLLHPNWRSRGVGDAVNATNISRSKMGDCEFIDARERTIHAYEAHGGVLTSLYMQQHLLTLRKTISARVDELATVADISEWVLTLYFVAHDIAAAAPQEVQVEGLRVRLVPQTFSTVFENILGFDEVRLMAAFQDMVLKPMRERRTPNVARHRLLQLVQ